MKDTLYTILSSWSVGFLQFERDQILLSDDFSWFPPRKKVDFADFDHKIIIEIDGPQHFSPDVKGALVYHQVVVRDVELNMFAFRKGYTLIRISYDQFVNNKFNDDCLSKLYMLLTSPKPGVHFIGDSYSK